MFREATSPPPAGPPGRTAHTPHTDDERVDEYVLLPPPEDLIRFFPIEGSAVESLVDSTRQRIRRILRGTDDRLLVVVGPCSIHDPAAALEYARRLQPLRARLAGDLEVVMRVYFEKPRTSVGWKGLINDPHLDGSFRIAEGLRLARQLLIDIAALGLPAGCELLETVTPQYVGDLVAWGAIGARTTESQVHRELASGSSAPIGFKNGTDGNVKIAVDAIRSAACPHRFLGVHKNGHIAMVRTRGNPDCHLILRGGRAPNYDAESVAAAAGALQAAGLQAPIMIDCSHGNSAKQHDRQAVVADEVAGQVAGGERRVVGVMLESHLLPGRQPFTPGVDAPGKLAYGLSITDDCLGWDETVPILERLAVATRRRRDPGRAGA